MSVAFNKFSNFVYALGKGWIRFGSDTFYVTFTNTLPTSGLSNISQINQIGPIGGMPTSGQAVSSVTFTDTNGVAAYTGAVAAFTCASSGGFPAFRYAVLYDFNNPTSAGNLVSWYDYGSTVNLTSGETFTVDFASNVSILTIN